MSSSKTHSSKITAKAPAFIYNVKRNQWILLFLSFILYSQTLTYDFVLDDAIVITDNMYTQEGIRGIGGIFSKDTFFGFFKEEGKAQLVQGGRYRPFTLMMFAIEKTLFGGKPWAHHLINILLYGFTGIIIYRLAIKLLLPKLKKTPGHLIAWAATLLFITHPIHTEVVANIKGRDEIMSLLGGLGALYCLLQHFEKKNAIWLVWAAVSFFVGLLSKENTITFLAIVPAALYYFTKIDLRSNLKYTAVLLLASILFLVIRGSVIGWQFGQAPLELMNNPFVKLQGNSYIYFTTPERLATIAFTLLLYLKLLVFPYPLTHDYYPRHIDMMSFSDPLVILSVFLHLGLVFILYYGWKRKGVLAFTVFYYIATLSIVSNIVFPVGTNMSERFLYMPSLGFCLALGYLLLRGARLKAKGLASSKIMVIATTVLALVFSAMTFKRNPVWKNNYALFTTDVNVSQRSAKLQNAAGGILVDTAFKLEDGPQKTDLLMRAAVHLDKAISIHPTYKNAFLLKGNAHNYLKQYPQSIDAYQKALNLDPDYTEALGNLKITYREAGRYYGEEKNDLENAIKYLEAAIQLDPNEYESNRLLGVAYGIGNNNQKAIQYFEKAAQIQPESATAWHNLSIAYGAIGDLQQEQLNLQKARALDPNVGQQK